MRKLQLGIIGLGLMGGSLALALRKYLPGVRIAGSDREREHLNYALEAGMIDRELSLEVKGQLDVLFIAVPARSVISVINQIAPELDQETIVTDLASTKCLLNREIREKFPGLNYIGGHPLTGREVSGPRGAQADLFREKKYILTVNPGRAENKKGSAERRRKERAVNSLTGMLEGIGARVLQLTPEGHDRLLAFTSHLPQLIATLLCEQLRILDEEDEPGLAYREMLGQGFLDMTRIAASDPEMWLDIFMTNRENLLEHLDRLSGGIEKFRQFLLAGNERELAEIFDRGREQRLLLVSRPGKGPEKGRGKGPENTGG